MAFNGQTKLPKMSSQNYTNILYSDSDSDSVPDLKLPPVKGRKFKRRKGSSGKHADPLCNLWTVLKLITAVVVFLVLVILAAACFWTFRQIRELQAQMAAYDNSDKVAVEMTRLQSQLAEVNASLISVKAGLASLPQITTTLVEVHKKLEELENNNKKVQDHSDASKELPNRVQLLSETLTTMGSDIRHMQDTSLLKSVDLENRLAELEVAVKYKNISSGRTGDRQEMVTFNESLVSGLQSLRQVLDQQSVRVKVLEDFTKSNNLKPSEDSAWVTELVTRLLEEKVSNLTSGGQAGVSTAKAVSAPSSVDNGKFLAFSADIVDNLKQINKTFDTLGHELEAVSSRLDSHDKALVDLTVIVRSIKAETSHSIEHNEVTAASVSPTSSSIKAEMSHSLEHTEVTASVSPTSSSTGWTSENTSLNNSTLGGEPSTESNKSRAVIHIEGINTREVQTNSGEDDVRYIGKAIPRFKCLLKDGHRVSKIYLHKAFQSDWPLENGELDVQLLNGLGPSLLDKDELKRFDADGNGYYSEDEMAVALDLHHNPRSVTNKILLLLYLDVWAPRFGC